MSSVIGTKELKRDLLCLEIACIEFLTGTKVSEEHSSILENKLATLSMRHRFASVEQYIYFLALRMRRYLGFESPYLDMFQSVDDIAYPAQNIRAEKGEEGLFAFLIQEFIHTVTVHDTRFFRHKSQLLFLQTLIFPQLLHKIKEKSSSGAALERDVKILSVGCSSGEEVYTIAMLLLASTEYDPTIKIKILGVDISEYSLEQARNASYSEQQIQAVPQEFSHFYKKNPNGSYSLSHEIHSIVEFSSVNLYAVLQDDDPFHIFLPKMYDCILCRNVLLYFSLPVAQKILSLLHNSLKTEGFLCIGPGEARMLHDLPFALYGDSSHMVYKPL